MRAVGTRRVLYLSRTYGTHLSRCIVPAVETAGYHYLMPTASIDNLANGKFCGKTLAKDGEDAGVFAVMHWGGCEGFVKSVLLRKRIVRIYPKHRLLTLKT